MTDSSQLSALLEEIIWSLGTLVAVESFHYVARCLNSTFKLKDDGKESCGLLHSFKTLLSFHVHLRLHYIHTINSHVELVQLS